MLGAHQTPGAMSVGGASRRGVVGMASTVLRDLVVHIVQVDEIAVMLRWEKAQAVGKLRKFRHGHPFSVENSRGSMGATTVGGMRGRWQHHCHTSIPGCLAGNSSVAPTRAEGGRARIRRWPAAPPDRLGRKLGAKLRWRRDDPGRRLAAEAMMVPTS